MGLRLSAAGIFLLGAVGLLLHSTLLETGHIRPGMFCFYTNLSNLLVLVYELALAVAPEGAVRRLLTGSGVALAMTLCIYVTHLIYHFVLVPDAKRRLRRQLREPVRPLRDAVAGGGAVASVGEQGGADRGLRRPVAGAAPGVLRVCHAAGQDGAAHRPHEAAVPLHLHGPGEAGTQKVLPQRRGGAGGVLPAGLPVRGPGAVDGIKQKMRPRGAFLTS